MRFGEARAWIVLGVAVSLAALSTAGKAAQDEGGDLFAPCAARDAPRFPEYFLGDQFEGFRRGGREAECSGPFPGEGGRTNYVSYVYGECDPGADGCLPAVEVQTWPVCDRNLSLYLGNPRTGAPLRHRRSRRRGVPAATFERDTRIELYTGAVTVVVFAANPRVAARAVAALHQPGGTTIGRLPDPVSGHLSGDLNCGFGHLSVKPARRHVCTRRRGGCASPGLSLRIRVPRPAFVTGVFARRGRRGFRPFGTVTFSVPAGTTRRRIRTLAFGRPLRPGRTRFTLRVSDNSGRRARPITVTFTARR